MVLNRVVTFYCVVILLSRSEYIVNSINKMDYKEKNMTILYRLSTVSGARWLEELHRIYNTDIVIKYNKATETKEDNVHYEKEKK